MTASVSNIIRPLDLGVTFLTRAAVGGADGTPPEGFVGTAGFGGINGSSSVNVYENGEFATVAGNWYGAWSAFTGATNLDMSGVGKSFVVHFRTASSYNNIDAIRISLRSGTGTTNWGYWDFDILNGNGDFTTWNPFRAEGTPDGTIGTFDNTDITGVSLQVRTNSGDFYAMGGLFDQFLFIDGPVIFEDTGTAAQVSMQSYFDLLERTSTQDYRSLLVNKAGTTFEFGFGVEFRCDDYQDTSVATGFSFMADNGFGIRTVAVGFYQARWVPPASSTQVFSGFTAATISSDYDMFIDASASGCSLDFSASLFAGVDDVDVSGSGVTFISSNILSPTTVEIGDADLQGLTIDACDNPVLITSDLVANSALNITNPVSDSLQFDLVAGDYSDLEFNVPASTVNINSSGVYNLSGIDSDGFVEFDNLTASAVTVTLDPNLTATVAAPTTGGGAVTLDNAVTVNLTVTVTDVSDTSPIENARIRLVAASGGPTTAGTVILEGLTDSFGRLTGSYVYTSTQPVTGTVRKATSTPYYKPGVLSGNITSTGYDVPVGLILD